MLEEIVGGWFSGGEKVKGLPTYKMRIWTGEDGCKHIEHGTVWKGQFFAEESMTSVRLAPSLTIVPRAALAAHNAAYARMEEEIEELKQTIAKLRAPQEAKVWKPVDGGFYDGEIFVWDYYTNKHEDSGRFKVGYNPDSNHNPAWLAFIHDTVMIEAQLPDDIRLCRLTQ